MTSPKRWPLLVTAALTVLACDSSTLSVDACKPRELNILFIGNSLTSSNDLPGLLAALADSAGLGPITVTNVSVGGTGLQDHWVNSTTRSTLSRGGWDLVILQQGPSATEGRPSLLEYSKRFAGEIRAVGAEVALYMVWPSRVRFGFFGEVFKSYHMAAENVGGLFFPSGESWRVAWETNPDLALYGGDNFHPSTLGTYAAALVMFHQVTGCSPVGLPSVLTTGNGVSYDIEATTARELQNAALIANRRHALPVPGWVTKPPLSRSR